MLVTRLLRERVALAALSALSVVALSLTASPASAKPTTPVPVCAGAHEQVVDVTQDVVNQPYQLAKDGRMWANFAYTQHLRIYAVGGQMYCIRKDFTGTWVSIAGTSPGLTGTISDGLTGTFQSTVYWEWTGTLTPLRPTSGYLGQVDAGCTGPTSCADDSYLLVDRFYFPQGSHHCNSVRLDTEIDGGTHGHISLSIDGDVNRFTGTGDITG